MASETPEQAAERLLPCKQYGTCRSCASHRPAVAAALRERDERIRRLEIERDELHCGLREGGDALHCPLTAPCVRCQRDRLRAALRIAQHAWQTGSDLPQWVRDIDTSAALDAKAMQEAVELLAHAKGYNRPAVRALGVLRKRLAIREARETHLSALRAAPAVRMERCKNRMCVEVREAGRKPHCALCGGSGIISTLPPCERCGGSCEVPHSSALVEAVRCPDCQDGTHPSVLVVTPAERCLCDTGTKTGDPWIGCLFCRGSGYLAPRPGRHEIRQRCDVCRDAERRGDVEPCPNGCREPLPVWVLAEPEPRVANRMDVCEKDCDCMEFCERTPEGAGDMVAAYRALRLESER